jgi:hypothetical protein
MATNVQPNVSNETVTVKLSKAEAQAQLIVKDATIVTDKAFVKLMTQLDKLTTSIGSKWGDTIEHVKRTYSPDDKDERKIGYAIILKSLMVDMNKPYTSASSTTSFIFKMAKSENSEDLELMKQGLLSVRAARSITKNGRPEGNEASTKSIEDKFQSTLQDAAKHAARLHYSLNDFLAKAKEKFEKQVTLQAQKEAVEAKKAEAAKAS